MWQSPNFTLLPSSSDFPMRTDLLRGLADFYRRPHYSILRTQNGSEKPLTDSCKKGSCLQKYEQVIIMAAMAAWRVSTAGKYTSRLSQWGPLNNSRAVTRHTLPHIGTHRHTSIKRHTTQRSHTARRCQTCTQLCYCLFYSAKMQNIRGCSKTGVSGICSQLLGGSFYHTAFNPRLWIGNLTLVHVGSECMWGQNMLWGKSCWLTDSQPQTVF